MYTCKSGKHTWLSQNNAAKCCNRYVRHYAISQPLTFCHRYLAIRALQQIAEQHSIPCQYQGELPTH